MPTPGPKRPILDVFSNKPRFPLSVATTELRCSTGRNSTRAVLETAQFGDGPTHFERIYEITAHALNIAQEIMLDAKNYFTKMSKKNRENRLNTILT